METLNYKVLEGTGYNGYILKDAPVKVMQFGEGNFLRAFVDYFYDIANEKAGYNGKVKLVQREGPEGRCKARDLLRVRLCVPLHRRQVGRSAGTGTFCRSGDHRFQHH